MIRRTTVLFLEILLALVVAAVVAVGAVAWRLSEGPIEIDWARGHLERALSDVASGLTTRIGSTTLSVGGWDRAFDVIAEDVELVDRNGTVRARIGTISVALSARALLAGQIAPKRVDILNPMVTVVRGVGGQWTVTPNDAAGGDRTAPLDAAELLEPMLGARGADGALAYLRSVELRGATILLVDDARGRTQRLSNVAGGVSLVAQGMTFRLRGQVDWTDVDPTPVAVTGDYQALSDRLQVDVRFEALPPRVLSGLDTRLARLAMMEPVVSGQLGIATKLDGSDFTASARLTLGTGIILAPEVNDTGFNLRGGSLAIDITEGGKRMTVDGSLDIDGVLLAATARLRKDRSGHAIVLDAVVSDLPVDNIGHFWPPKVSDGAREWVTENLTTGRVTSATLRAEGWVDDVDPSINMIDALSGRIDFEGVDTHYFRPLPPVVDVSGSATFDATRMDIAIDGGRLGALVLEPSTVAMVNLDRDTGERADVEVIVRGPVREALQLLDRKPLGYQTRIGLDAAHTAGEFGARVRFEIPLLRTLDVEDIGIAAAANLRQAVVPGVLRGQDLTDGDLSLDLTGASMSLSGTANIAGVAAQVTHEERFQVVDAYQSRSTLTATPTIGQLTAFGLDLNDIGTGPVAIEASVTTDPTGVLNASVTGDLQGTEMHVSEIGWSKLPDTAGIVRVDIHRASDGHLSIPGFEFRASDLFASGSVDFPEAGGTITDLARFRFGRTDAAGRLEVDPDGTVHIGMQGPVIDLVPLLDTEEDSGAQSRLQARFAAETLYVLDGVTLTGGTLGVDRSGARIQGLEIVGALDGAPLRLIVQPAEGRRLVTVATPDAGGFLRAFGIADSIQGGRLRVDGELIGDGFKDAMNLAVQIDEFRIADAPVFARVLSIASFSGLLDAVSGDGIRFARATADIALDRDTIRISRGLAYGPGLGLKVEGTLGRETDTVDVEGLIAPAYSLSRLIDTVPVLGELLTGGEGEGLLATSYAVTGTVKEPRITVNPLTALAPGFLRDILTAASRPAEGPVTWSPLPPPGLGDGRGR